MWDEITADQAIKEAICCDWLLSEETWNKFFNNWCPMTRGYYMRLVCWRLCRDSGTANSSLIAGIFLLVSQRLKTAWSHYLWLRNNAKSAPSTVPCLPAPSKRFIIIRSEVVQPQPGLLMAFDAFPGSGSDTVGAAAVHGGNLSGSGESYPPSAAKGDTNQTYKKKWTLLGKVLSFSAPGQGLPALPLVLPPRLESVPGMMSSSKPGVRRPRRAPVPTRTAATAPSLAQAGPPPPPKSSGLISSSESDSSTGSSPTYEATQYVFRFGLQSYNFPTKAIILSPPRLPAPAQARVSSARAASQTETFEAAAIVPHPSRLVCRPRREGLAD